MSQLLNWICEHKKANRCAITYRNSGSDDYLDISYEELHNYIISLSGYLTGYKNKNIAIIGNNKLEYVVSLLSVLCNIGNAFVVDKELNQDGLDSLFDVVKPDLIILDDEINLSAQKAEVLKFSQINEIMKANHSFDVDDFFAGNLILHTSGTTGAPKCIELTEEMYLYIIKDLNTAWKVTHEHSCLFIIPLYHIYALTSLFHGIYAGVRSVLEWDYARLSSVLQKTNPSIFPGVPLIFNKVKDTAYANGGSKLKFGLALSNFLLKFNIDIRKKLFKDIHAYFGNNYYFAVSGGSMANPETNKFFDDIGLPLYNGYGMTETSGPITICYENNNRYDSVGKILHNDIKVINADENGIGEICIAGTNIIKQYINEENSDCFADGYFNTGDLGYVKDGFLYITGRRKDILIGDNGKNISTAELSKLVLEHTGINDCILKMENNKILAIIDTSLSPAEVSKHIESINATLPNYKKISDFKIISKGFSHANS